MQSHKDENPVSVDAVSAGNHVTIVVGNDTDDAIRTTYTGTCVNITQFDSGDTKIVVDVTGLLGNKTFMANGVTIKHTPTPV